jgi:hypothetical protein
MNSPSLHQLVSERLQAIIAEAPAAVVIENGEVLFDFSTAKFSLRAEGERCVLQIWSTERNIVRRVVGAEVKNGVLKLEVLRFGQAKPTKLEICGSRERRAPTAKRIARAGFQRLLGRMLEKTSPGWKLESLVSTADLEHSFGPGYVRGLLRRGSSAMAVVGVGEDETQAAVDGMIATAVLWLEHCRERYANRMHVAGARLFVPRGRAEVVRLRLAHLNHALAKWELAEFDAQSETLEELDARDAGNVASRLVQAADRERAMARFAEAIAKVQRILPQVEIEVVSAAELSFRYHGLEFARATMQEVAGSFRTEPVLLFPDSEAPGAGKEIAVDAGSEPGFGEFVKQVAAMRDGADRHHPLHRSSPERWLVASVRRDLSVLDEQLDATVVYSQVPAFSGGDRGMIDLLGVTREGRLAVIELKAEEDMHLPLQGLDYWARVRWHQQRGEFQRFGYFAGRELSPEPPLLLMAAPSLHVHPTTDCLLRHLSPEIEWKLLGLDEHWRRGIRVVFRKTNSDFRFQIENFISDF